MSEPVIENIKKYYLEMLPFNKVLGIDMNPLNAEAELSGPADG